MGRRQGDAKNASPLLTISFSVLFSGAVAGSFACRYAESHGWRREARNRRLRRGRSVSVWIKYKHRNRVSRCKRPAPGRRPVALQPGFESDRQLAAPQQAAATNPSWLTLQRRFSSALGQSRIFCSTAHFVERLVEGPFCIIQDSGIGAYLDSLGGGSPNAFFFLPSKAHWVASPGSDNHVMICNHKCATHSFFWLAQQAQRCSQRRVPRLPELSQ